MEMLGGWIIDVISVRGGEWGMREIMVCGRGLRGGRGGRDRYVCGLDYWRRLILGVIDVGMIFANWRIICGLKSCHACRDLNMLLTFSATRYIC
jgi:hypothetical protein